MIGEFADVDPLAPSLGGLPHLVGRLRICLRHRVFGPAQRNEHVIALGQPGAGARFPAFQSQPQIRGELQRRIGVGVLGSPTYRLAVSIAGVLPDGPSRW